MSWHSELSFAERIENVKRLTSSISSHILDGVEGEALAQAQSLEKSIYQGSTSLVQYYESCAGAAKQATITVNGHFTMTNEDEDSECEPESAAEPPIGIYHNPTHHRDGLFSSVFKVRSPSDTRDGFADRMVALKVMTPCVMVQPHDAKREAAILKDLKHDHVIQLIDCFKYDGSRLVLVFPFMIYDLQSLLAKRRISKNQSKCHLRDLFSALAYIHSFGIIHRDVKPANILMRTPSGPAYLADFGISWSPEHKGKEEVDQKLTDVGTTCYRPPSILFGQKNYDSSHDLWSAGCVAAETATLSCKSLFDSGDAGADLTLLKSMFMALGTPTPETWPEAQTFPDWDKLAFKSFPPKPWGELLPEACEKGRDLVSRLVRFESKDRLSAKEALEHPYFVG